MAYANIWDKYHNTLTKTAMDRLFKDNPEISLFVAIIVQAGKDRDRDFLYSDNYEYYCNMLKLQAHSIRLLFEQTWKQIDNKSPLDLSNIEEQDCVENDSEF